MRSGLFKDMSLLNQTLEGNVVPKLLGCYEQELHDVLERCIETPFGHVLNIGCGDSYHAVGLARCMPNSEIKPYDLKKDRRVLIVCDIEGGVRELPDPEHIPALKGYDKLVALHKILDKALPEIIIARFVESHQIERFQHQDRAPHL